jgi:pimeloyl-ACP methyl ester carboxylesterase
MNEQQSGHSIVFIHGSGDSAQTWRPLMQRLPDERCIALDLPGHGTEIANPGPERMGIADYAEAVRGELERRGLHDVYLVGHSLGSAIALHMALTLPALVRGIVLVGSGARLRVAPQLLEVARTNPADASTMLADWAFAPGHEAMARAYYAAQEPTAPGMLYRDLAACDTFDMMADLGSITQPALIVTGEADRLTPPKYATFLKEHLPHATLAMIPDAGHYVAIEQPDAVAAAIRDWLAALP